MRRSAQVRKDRSGEDVGFSVVCLTRSHVFVRVSQALGLKVEARNLECWE